MVEPVCMVDGARRSALGRDEGNRSGWLISARLGMSLGSEGRRVDDGLHLDPEPSVMVTVKVS